MNHLSKKIICLLLALLLLTGLAGCGKSPKESVPQEQTEPAITQPKLQTKEGIQTILILCLDAFDTENGSGGFRNASRADFAMLMVIDEPVGQITSLQLNPDTIVPFVIPGTSETVEMPLGEIYSYGSGGSDSCLNVTKAVSQLLHGIKVDHYLTFTMDSVGIVNDMIGGVAIPGAADEDSEGAEEAVVLSGAEAVAYFSERSQDDITNENHMARQRLYMEGLYQPFMEKAQNEDFLTRLSLQLGERMGTGLTLSQLIAMFESMSVLAMAEEILSIPGDAGTVDGKIYFHPDEAALERIVNTLFVAQ